MFRLLLLTAALLSQSLSASAQQTAPAQSENCIVVSTLSDAILREVTRLGGLESSRLEGILFTAGMRLGALNPAGVDNDDTCGAAIAPLRAYLDDLQNRDSGFGNTYTRTNAQTVDRNGVWALTTGDVMTLWTHIGSEMAWEAGPGSARKVWYWAPRASLAPFGITRGTLLFEGERQGARMVGQARVFTRNCGVYTYPVAGPITNADRRVTLYGTRPVVDADCRILRTADETLVFDYIADAPQREANLARPAPPAFAPPGFGVWATTFSLGGVDTGLNLRTAPSPNAPIIAALPPGADDILVIAEGCVPEIDQIAFDAASPTQKDAMIESRWCNVQWNTLQGWVFGAYLRANF